MATVGDYAILWQRLSGTRVFDFIGHLVADVDEFLGVFTSQLVVLNASSVAHRLFVLVLDGLIEGASTQGRGNLLPTEPFRQSSAAARGWSTPCPAPPPA